MWTGGKPPRIPQSSRKEGVPTAAARPAGVNAELEALKQRGLAKMLNKHFTQTAKQLAEEKAAADSALADLERRKANTSEFQASGNIELSPLDAMYVSVNNWRNECRRKERETLLLYQRYVNKFGNTGQVQLPENGIVRGERNKEAQAWIAKDGSSDDKSVRRAAPPVVPPSKQIVPALASEIERTLDEYIQKGALSLPSVEVLGKDETFKSLQERQEAEFRNYYRKKMEERGADVVSPEKPLIKEKEKVYVGPGAFSPDAPAATGGDPLIRTIGDGKSHDVWCKVPEQPLAADTMAYVSDEDDDDDEGDDLFDLPLNHLDAAVLGDDGSVVSGLTSIHSQITRSVIHDCERSVVEFLKEERKQIQKMIKEEMDNGEIRAENLESTKKTEEAENMVLQMQDILNEFQSQYMDDLESVGRHEPRKYETNNPDENWMVYYDEFYKQEYYHECNSNRTQWDPPSKDGSSVNASITSASGSDHTVGTSAADQRLSSNMILLTSDDVIPEQGGMMMEGRRNGNYESRIAQYRRKRKRQRRRKVLASLFLTTAFAASGAAYYFYYRDSAVPKAQSKKSVEEAPPVVETTKKVSKKALTKKNQTKEAALLVEAPPTVGIPEKTSLKPQTEQHTGEASLPTVEKKRSKDTSVKKKPVAKGKFEENFIHEVVHSAPETDYEEDNKECQVEKEVVEKAVVKAESPKNEIMALPWVCNIPLSHWVDPRCSTAKNKDSVFELKDLILMTTSFELEAEVITRFLKDENEKEMDLSTRPWGCNIPFSYMFHPKCDALAKVKPAFNLQEFSQSMIQ